MEMMGTSCILLTTTRKKEKQERATAMKRKGEIAKGVMDDNNRARGRVIERGKEEAAGANEKHWWMRGQKLGNEKKQQMPIGSSEG